MRNFLLTRVGVGLLVTVIVSVLAFSLLRLSGDLALEYAGVNATMAQIEQLRHDLGLDRPLPLQYFDWAQDLITGNMGYSLFTQEPVSALMASHLSVTAKLAGMALLFALIVSIPLGIASAYKQNSWVHWLETALVTLGQSVPSFWLALMLSAFFGIYLGWLPVAGTESLRHFVLPTITLGIAVLPVLTRITKTGIAEVLRAKFIQTARAKGLSTAQILIVHALPNAILPIVSLASVQLGQLLAGSVVIETVFAMDGIGRLALLSIERVDFPVVQAIVICLAAIYVLLTLLADILNMLIDPRLRINT